MNVDIEKANREACERILKGKPYLKGISTAGESIPGMKKNLILHSGPPLDWERMCGPLRGAVIGGLIYEGFAKNVSDAEDCISSGEILFEPCNHHNAVGPMAGVITWSMPLWIIENRTFGNLAYSNFNEGLGKVLRYGAYSEEVIQRLKWMEEELAPVLKEALESHGELDLKSLMAQALQMGDELHNRNKAATSLFIRELVPHLVTLMESKEKIARVLTFLNSNDHFFLNLSMASAKSILDGAKNIEGSSIVVTMARNGTDFGIMVSGIPDRWFVAPANMVEGLYLPGFSTQDAAPDIGDSVIAETAGIGGFAMAGAPAIVKFVGGTPKDALNYTLQMYEITSVENDYFQIPFLNFRGTPTGIDIIKVVETGILPVINTGIAGREAGVGMVGAGIVKPPMRCFLDAFKTFVDSYGNI